MSQVTKVVNIRGTATITFTPDPEFEDKDWEAAELAAMALDSLMFSAGSVMPGHASIEINYIDAHPFDLEDE